MIHDMPIGIDCFKIKLRGLRFFNDLYDFVSSIIPDSHIFVPLLILEIPYVIYSKYLRKFFIIFIILLIVYSIEYIFELVANF